MVVAAALLAVVFGCLMRAEPASGAFFQKEFVVCQDQGRDVLCDAYVVRKDDYVTKLFQQRGEIAYRDFPEFLEIFKRLNPTVQNIDLIFPGQRILVPLKIIAPNTLEGQDTGTVTIPLITITNIPEQLQQNSLDYVVQPGDCVSALIAQKFGRYSSQPYKEAMEIFKYLNPHIKDLNQIHVGQTINIPVPTIREEVWYPEIFDEAGELVVNEEAPGVSREEPPEEAAEKPVEPPKNIEPIAVEEPPVAEETLEIEEAPKEEAPPAEEIEAAPAPVPLAPLPSIFKKAAAIFGAELLDTGQYFFPRQGQADLKLDLAATPVMEFPAGFRILFAKTDTLPSADQSVVGAFWKNVRIVTLSYDASLRELLYTICRITDPHGCENTISIKDKGVSATVGGELIFKNTKGPGKVCVALLDHAGQSLPEPLHQFLEKHQLLVREWVDGENFFGPAPMTQSPGLSAGHFITSDASQPAAFIADFAAAFGMKYQAGVEVSFPCAGFQITARSNLLSIAPGREYLVDFGDLQGEAVTAIEATGFQVLQFSPNQSRDSIVSALLAAMPVDIKINPVFFGAAERPQTCRVVIEVAGRLVTLFAGSGTVNVLIVETPCDAHILSFLNLAGVRVMQLGGR